jgi:hypothetical protein
MSLAKSTDFVLASSGCYDRRSVAMKGVIGRRWAMRERAPGELEAAF